MANTPWGLWFAAGKENKDSHVAKGSLSATMDDSRRHRLNEHMKGKQQDDFGWIAWMQSDRNNIAWVTTCPKEHSSLNAGQFRWCVRLTLVCHRRAWRDRKGILSCTNLDGRGGGIGRRSATCPAKTWSRRHCQEEGGHAITMVLTWSYTISSCSRP